MKWKYRLAASSFMAFAFVGVAAQAHAGQPADGSTQLASDSQSAFSVLQTHPNGEAGPWIGSSVFVRSGPGTNYSAKGSLVNPQLVACRYAQCGGKVTGGVYTCSGVSDNRWTPVIYGSGPAWVAHGCVSYRFPAS